MAATASGSFFGYNQVNTVVTAYGEAGIDYFNLSGGFGQATADGGDGGDRFDIYLSGASFTISLGAETDYIVLRQVDWGHVAMVVTDFDTGANGDILVWDEIPHQMTYLMAAIRFRPAMRVCYRAEPHPAADRP